MSQLEIKIVIDQDDPWSPEDASNLLDRLVLPVRYHVVRTQFEPLDELDAVAELIEEELYREALDALNTVVVIWGDSPGTTRLFTRIDRIRILGK